LYLSTKKLVCLFKSKTKFLVLQQKFQIIAFLLLNDIVPKGSNHYLAVNNSFFAEGIS
jgi:hypothetical protein